MIRLHEFNLTTIPAELRALPQWVLWAQVAGKKVPRQARSPQRNASVTNPATWSSFETASKAAADIGLGLGFVFTSCDPFVFIDLDWSEQPSDLQRGIIERLASYTEVSPSGCGAHVFVSGDKARITHATKVDSLGVEIYVAGRYSTITGNVVPYGLRQVQNRTNDVLDVISSLSVPKGRRNNSMTRLAGRMRHAGMDKAEISGSLIRANLEVCNPPLRDDEVVGIANRVGSYDVSGFLSLPRRLLLSSDFAALTNTAKALLLDIAARFTGKNNGSITVPFVAMQERGWRSTATVQKGLKELIAAGFLKVTRKGGSHRCTTYRLPWLQNHQATPTRLSTRNSDSEQNSVQILNRSDLTDG